MTERLDIHALADGQLEPSKAQALRAELAANVEAAAQYEAVLQTKRALQGLPQPECREAWKACVVRLDAIDRTRRVERFVGKYAWALCGVAFMAIMVAGIEERGLNGRRLRSEDIAQTATSLVATRVPKVQDNQAMDAYLDALLGQARRSLAPDRLQVVAGAVGELNGRHVTRLTLRDADGDMALLVIPGTLDFVGMEPATYSGRPYFQGVVDGFNCVAWTVDGTSAILMGNRPYESLGPVAARVTNR